MPAAETHRLVARILNPVLYAGSFVPLIVGSIAVVSVVERSIGFDNFTTFRYIGDVVAAASVLMIGGFVFGLQSQFLMWFEQLRMPTLRDHLRHCVALYVLLGTLAVPLVRMYESAAAYRVSLGDGIVRAVCFTVGYAICIDAMVLLLKHRVEHRGLGNNA